MIHRRQFSPEQDKNIARVKDALGWSSASPTDAVAVKACYETCGRTLRDVAVRHFGENQLPKKAVLNLLVAVVLRAWSYDPQAINASERVSCEADAEARKLREALDAGGLSPRAERWLEWSRNSIGGRGPYKLFDFHDLPIASEERIDR
jgi:hypothetical protein